MNSALGWLLRRKLYEATCGASDIALGALAEAMGMLGAYQDDGQDSPGDPAERSWAFGDRHEGVLTYYLDENEKKIWILSIVWLE